MSLKLAENKTTAYRVICAISDDPAVANAAGEFVSYFKKLTSCGIPVDPDSIPETEKEIVIGRTRGADANIPDIDALGEDGFVIRVIGERLYLLGASGRGTLYAVYEFLERFGGCRFYTSDFEKIPSVDTLCVPLHTDIREVPVFTVRNVFWWDYIGREKTGDAANATDRFCAKRKTNGRKFSQIAKKWGSSAAWAGAACHTLYALAEMKGDNHLTEPCLSDEYIFETVLKNVRLLLDENPGASFISVSQNDSYADGVGCMCDKCAAILRETGSYAGSYIRFVNRIADAIREDYPGVTIHTFAYRFTRKPPIGVKPAKNVTVEMCTIEGCFRHALAECDAIDDPCMKTEAFPALLSKWSALSETLSIWDYTTDFAHYNITFPNFGVLRKNARLFADNNAKYIFEQGAHTSRNGEFCALRGYLLAKLLWNPYMSEEEYTRLTHEFIDDYYGAGAPYIKEYLALAMEATKDHHMPVYDHPHAMYPNTRVLLRTENDPIPLKKAELANAAAADLVPYLDWFERVVPHPLLTEGKKLFDAALYAEQDPILHEHLEASFIQWMTLHSFFAYEVLCVSEENLARVLRTVDSTVSDERIAALTDTALASARASYRAENERLIETMRAQRVYDLQEGFDVRYTPIAHPERDPAHWL